MDEPMVSLASLWLPILLSAVLVFIASSVIWMLLPYHRNDWKPLPNEEAFRSAFGGGAVPPGQYSVPFGGGPEAMKDPAFVRKMQEGPVGFITLLRPAAPSMGKELSRYFLYTLAVSYVVGYLVSRTVPAGQDYLPVFRVAGVAAFLAYSGALIPQAIWFGRSWSTVWKDVGDGLVYALLTAGAFAALWPGQ